MQENAFTVEPAALRQLAGDLVRLSAKLDEARVVTQQVDTSGFGSAKLMQAAEHFVSHWSFQAQQIATTASDTGNRLASAAGQYESVENSQLQAQGQGTTA